MVGVSFEEPEVYVETTSAGSIRRGYRPSAWDGWIAGGSFAGKPGTVVARPGAGP